MQAGKLQHRIELQRLSESLGPNRQAVQTWTPTPAAKLNCASLACPSS